MSIPRELAARLPGFHEAQERQETENLIAAGLADEMGVDVRRGPGELWSVRCASAPRHRPGNQVMGVGPEQLDALPEIADWFEAAGCTLHLRWPAPDLPDAADRLDTLGFRAHEVEAWMAARIDDVRVDAPAHDIAQVASPDGLADWIRAFFGGWQITDPALQRVAQAAMGPWPAPPTWYRYVARVDGEPAGEALLVTFDGVAYLAEASTVPAYRKRGIQRALIARRLDDARAMGFTTVFGAVAVGDASWSNMRAMGLRDVFTTVAFRRYPSTT